ncbi:MAG: hypothetical protein WC972_03060 [Trueperaceae bacterium]
MKLGDTLTITGVTFTVRPFTAAEHAAFDELAEEHQLQRKAAEAQALAGTRGGTAREALLRSEAKRLQDRLNDYLIDGALKENLGEGERLAAFEVAAQLDEFTVRVEELRQERTVEALIREEELAQARETVTIAFAHTILKPPMTLDEFTAALTPAELMALDEVVALGKLRAGLSASNRRQAALWDQQVELLSKLKPGTPDAGGNDSASPPQPPAAPAKPGRTGRSKKSSSTSKGGA